MARHAQTKTAQGYLPFQSVQLVQPAEAEPTDELATEGDAESAPVPANPFDASLAFDLLPPHELAAREREGSLAELQPPKTCNLVALGACTQSSSRSAPNGSYTVSEWRPAVDSLLEFAQESGPLFGQDEAPEALRDWGRAADAAMVASRIQEVVNGSAEIKTLKSIDTVVCDGNGEELNRVPRIYKERFCRTGAPEGESFVICSTTIAPTGAYQTCFSRLPLVQRVGPKSCGYLYAFAQWEEMEGDWAVGFYIVCLPHEISAAEFGFLSETLALSPELADLSAAELGFDAEEGQAGGAGPESSLISPGCEYDDEPEPLAPEDKDILASLVRTMVLAHMGGVRIDPFQSSEATGNHSFDTLLSWLWYDFSSSLSRVSIGYCRRCGRPYSLVGHRGVKREFCSQKCKTDAKNERSKAQRDAAREAFAKDPQATVEQIAQKAYGSASKADLARTRESLSSWVALKGELEDDIAAYGFGRSPLFRRCLAMDLDVKKLLNSKRWQELQRFAQQRRG